MGNAFSPRANGSRGEVIYSDQHNHGRILGSLLPPSFAGECSLVDVGLSCGSLPFSAKDDPSSRNALGGHRLGTRWHLVGVSESHRQT